ncbi:MAG TPA: 4-(cytidine 5'-diphospho)-2-C-methyl-D-erythritol kinase [Solirubrobacteraceae bacterium]|nr:4-(cytidine 5'-diphospho)-2-C-methyl-D-erythritol kinase [Solirubrobacteraceae bacterium]
MTTDIHAPGRVLQLPLRALAPAKINLGLHVGPTRGDGRHELVTVMQSISLADELTLAVAPAGAEHDELVCAGVSGAPRENLAARALAAFRDATGWARGPLRLTIEKRIPVAAGLGGGSADAAAALRLAACASGLGDHELLLELGAALGADVPAQIAPGRWLAGGAGERLEALPHPREELGVLVLPVAAALSTAAVYREFDARGAAQPLALLQERHDALRAELSEGAALPLAQLLHNDLEAAARALCPAIDEVLAQAREAGAEAALVSGSGPTVVGLFKEKDGAARACALTRARAQHIQNPALTPYAATPVGPQCGIPTTEFSGSVGHN